MSSGWTYGRCCSVIPYLLVRDNKLVPLPVVVNAAGLLLSSSMSAAASQVNYPSQVQCRYLNELCTSAGLDFTFDTSTPLIDLSVVCTMSRPAPYMRELPGKDPFMHAHFIDERLLTDSTQTAPSTHHDPPTTGSVSIGGSAATGSSAGLATSCSLQVCCLSCSCVKFTCQ